MTILKHLENDQNWDLYEDNKLNFAEPNNSSEAEENLSWVLENDPCLEGVTIVVRSYHTGIIKWEML